MTLIAAFMQKEGFLGGKLVESTVNSKIFKEFVADLAHFLKSKMVK